MAAVTRPSAHARGSARVFSARRSADTHYRRSSMTPSPGSGRPRPIHDRGRAPLRKPTLHNILSRCSAASGVEPPEVTRARADFEKAYAPIRPRVQAQADRYRGTAFEDCPPMLEAEFRFLVDAQDVRAAHERLLRRYGRCALRWALLLGWLRKERRERRRLLRASLAPAARSRNPRYAAARTAREADVPGPSRRQPSTPGRPGPASRRYHGKRARRAAPPP